MPRKAKTAAVRPDAECPSPLAAAPSSPPKRGPDAGGSPTRNPQPETRNARFQPRAGQKEFERGVELHRVSGLVARRQYGKTSIASRIALRKMMRTPGHTVVFGSVKLDLGREIVRKEAEALQAAFRTVASDAHSLQLADSESGKAIINTLDADAFADLYEHSRLEFRLYHDRTTYSRTKVVALTAAAVGETGDMIIDEPSRVRNFREVWEAVTPIIASNPSFRCLLTLTPPLDDSHYTFELLAPPVGADLPISPCGNWYRSELGVWVLRVTAEDAFADGLPLYDDDTGAPISPAESRQRAADKDAWDRNYGCKFVIGGTAACGFIALDTAQARGIGQCALFQCQNDGDFAAGITWLAAHVGTQPVALGFDVATTTKGSSNPSALAVVEDHGKEVVVRAVFTWKTNDPAVATERVARTIATLATRKTGGRARKLCIDGSNEAYFATALKTHLRAALPVEIVKGGEVPDLPGEPMNNKQRDGGRLIALLDDNHLTLPPERALKADWRLVRKDRGQLVCEPDPEGHHGDTFDATKLAVRALKGGSAGVYYVATGHRADVLAERRKREVFA